MKIEICEQMVQSWLQHCKQCDIVQTNWTISPLRSIDDAEIKAVSNIMKEIQDQLNQALEDETKQILQQSVDEELGDTKKGKSTKLNIFKKNKASQFIRQCEIDVVGCKLDGGITERIYLVDTAFHKTGLGYHDAVATVVKKIVRALLVSLIIFGEDVPVTVAFATPECLATLKTKIEKVVNDLRNILAADTRYKNIEIELYFNERFSSDIFVPLIDNIDNLNNGNDLFMRSMILAMLAEKHKASGSAPSTPATAKESVSTAKSPRGENERTVFGIMKQMISDGKMTPAMVDDLRKPSYASTSFSMPKYPILLKENDFPFSGYERCRFYKTGIKINGEVFLVCSQWIPDRIAKLKAWHSAL